MESESLYEVTFAAGASTAPTRTVTDAAGVTELVRQAADSGTRVHIRPLAVPEPGES